MSSKRQWTRAQLLDLLATAEVRAEASVNHLNPADWTQSELRAQRRSFVEGYLLGSFGIEQDELAAAVVDKRAERAA